MASAVLPLMGVRRSAPVLVGDHPHGSWGAVFGAAPTAFGAAFLSGVTETAIFSLLPLYGLRQGLAEPMATAMLTAVGAGGVLLQLPLGWLADRWGRMRVLAAAVAAGALGALLLAPACAQPLTLWPLLFLWGGAVSGFYTLALAAIGDRFSSAGTVGSLAAANVVCVMAYNLGMLIGPAAGGAAFDLWPPHGLPATLVALFAAFLLLSGLARRRWRWPMRTPSCSRRIWPLNRRTPSSDLNMPTLRRYTASAFFGSAQTCEKYHARWRMRWSSLTSIKSLPIYHRMISSIAY